jgi:hypothetical protein
MKRSANWTLIYAIADKLEDDESSVAIKEEQKPEEIDLRFAQRIRRLIAEHITSQYQLACLSTLGGAYHLCNRPHVALQIALQQEEVGRRMNSFTTIIRAKVFQAVNMKLLGNSEMSNRLMNYAYKLVEQSGLQNMKSFVIASHQWLERNYGNTEPKEEDASKREEISDSSCEI